MASDATLLNLVRLALESGRMYAEADWSEHGKPRISDDAYNWARGTFGPTYKMTDVYGEIAYYHGAEEVDFRVITSEQNRLMAGAIVKKMGNMLGRRHVWLAVARKPDEDIDQVATAAQVVMGWY